MDTSVWVQHFRRSDSVLQALLATDQVLCHPFVLLELACGTPPAPRQRTLSDLRRLRQAVVATTDETLAMIESERLYGLGCGAIDLALLASALLTPDTLLWTADKNLHKLAKRFRTAFSAVRGPASS